MKLARVNTLLLVAILLINGYIIILPVIPNILFQLERRDSHHVKKLEAAVSTQKNSNPPRPTTDRLIVPSMVFDEEIHEGKTAATLKQGLWRRPNTSTPDKGGNTVIVGHRLTYDNPKGTLYNLDKVSKGDLIGIWWHGKRYVYTVSHTKVVHANELSVEAPTKDPTLTIYTCTPLWLPKDRLVVTAVLKEMQ